MRMRLIHLLLAIAATAASLRAESYIIADNQTGHVLEESAKDRKVPVASLTKLALSLVVLDWAQLGSANLDAKATVPAEALSTTGGINPLGLQAGDEISLRDLLYASLLASDNVAAVTLADHVGRVLPNPTGLDPVGNTVAHMNALARQLGMKRTLFLNPHGLDAPETGARPHSTAADLARLSRYAYSKPGIAFYVSQPTREIHVGRGGAVLPLQLANTNHLLGSEGIDGVKTGRTTLAGECIILTSERTPEVRREGDTVFTTPRRIIVVLLGSDDREGKGLSLTRRGWQLYQDWASQGRPAKASNCL